MYSVINENNLQLKDIQEFNSKVRAFLIDDDNNIWAISILGTTNRLYTHIKNTNGDGQVIYLIYDESTHSLTTSIEKNNQFEVDRKVETIYPQDIEIRCNEY